jgi:hypothetical protein
MLNGLEIIRISRAGHDYVLHFSDGSYGIFSAEDIEPVLPLRFIVSMPAESSRESYLN